MRCNRTRSAGAWRRRRWRSRRPNPRRSASRNWRPCHPPELPMPALPNTGTPVRDALEGAITAIAAAGCETPRLDAELLLAHALGVPRERLLTDPDMVVSGSAVRTFQNAVRRRSVEREPVAYILGRRGFRRIELAVDARALVPRPETELLVEV